MSSYSLRHYAEPELSFGHDQRASDPRDGLFFFGPLGGPQHPSRLRIGVIGTPAGLAYYREWAQKVSRYVPSARPEAPHHVAYPGFEACFRAVWPSTPVVEIALSGADISKAIRIADRHIAVYEVVSLFEGPIVDRLNEEDTVVDVWFVIVPDEVYQFGRPLARVPIGQRIAAATRMNAKLARSLRTQPSLFEEDMEAAKVYGFDLNFHHQLKARMLDSKAVVQIGRESSIAGGEPGTSTWPRMQDPATIAWNLSTSVFYKAGGKPWKLASLRDGVCYVGLVFKKLSEGSENESASCGAQMFLDSGDGLVFKGALGNWYSREKREFHLSQEKAEELILAVLRAYVEQHGSVPRELFIHAKTRLNVDEWNGILAATARTDINVVGVRIARSSDIKLFRPGKTPVLRGTALLETGRRGHLWTAGYIPTLETYPGREVPNPLSVEVVRGEADLEVVMRDVLSLTKLNFNACLYGDGLPVTLRFADAVGEILAARPEFVLPPLSFRHYI